MILTVVVGLAVSSLGDVPRSAVLLGATEQFEQSAPPLVPAQQAPFIGQPLMGEPTSAQLLAEIAVLRRERPGLGGAVTLLSIGGGLGIAGIFYFALSGLAGGFTFSNPLMVIGLVGMCIGLPMALIGTWLLIGRLNERQRIGVEIRRVENELKALRSRGLTSMGPAEPAGIGEVVIARF